jgi:hypothetical protein
MKRIHAICTDPDRLVIHACLGLLAAVPFVLALGG